MKKLLLFLLLFTNTISLSKAQSLEDYFVMAAKNNPKVQADYKEFEIALQKIAQVNVLPDPTLSLGYFLSPIETRVGAQRARAELSQMFPWFGTLQAKENLAALQAEAMYQRFLNSKNQIFYQVSAAYYPLYELQKLKEIENQNIEILKTYKNIATIKFENGQGSMVNVLRVDIMLKEAMTNLEILRKKEQPLLSRFKQIVNLKEEIENKKVKLNFSPSDSTLLQKSYSFTDLALQKDSLLINNPILEELETQIKASQAKEEVVIKEGLPKIGVGITYIATSKRTDMDLPQNGKDAIMPMASISLPIYRKKYKAAQKQAQLEQELFQLKKEDKTNELLTSYDKILFDLQKQQDLIKLYNEQIKESEQILRLLYSAYSNAGVDFEEVLRMQQQVLSYQKKIIMEQTAYQISIAELNYLTHKN
ncbi:TolC family protein [Bernardetia sp. MNP-M8]|uniref:TolC family protein n=1 Tax=Bernardetia sp. MNP-M8 TaxID=3127470 RepID=UPI0030CB5643